VIPGAKAADERRREEIEDLHALADECREWKRTIAVRWPPHPSPGELSGQKIEMGDAWLRIADTLDEIAKRLAGKST
jgi:hypothetical protein